MPEEAAFFGRSGLFGVALAAIYWFVSYEIVGTVMLGGFGLATAAAFLVLGRSARGARLHARNTGKNGTDDALETASEAPFADEGGPVPLSSAAPLWVGLGLAVMGLGLAFGVWFVLAGLVPLALGASSWLSTEIGES
jgi:hypothetical protein